MPNEICVFGQQNVRNDLFLKPSMKEKYLRLSDFSRLSLATKIKRANEKRSFIFKSLTSNRMRASRLVTYEKSAKYCKVSFIYGVLKSYFDNKSCKQVSKIILVYICVVFKAGFFLFLINNGFISCL